LRCWLQPWPGEAAATALARYPSEIIRRVSWPRTLHDALRNMRSFFLIGFITSGLLAGCGTSDQGDDELDGESAADGEDGKGDAASAFTYFMVTPDLRQCSFDSPPDCGSGYYVARANRSTTECGRGLAQESCKVEEIDWTGTALPSSVAMNYASDLADGTPYLVRGDLVPAPDDSGVSLSVTEVWISSSPSWESGVFTRVKDNGIRCITSPCPSLSEQKLNSNLGAAASGLDFEPSGADQDAIDLAYDQLYGEDGLIVVGYRYYDSQGGKGRTVNKFFTRAPVPLMAP
jgi:hypothetical protein